MNEFSYIHGSKFSPILLLINRLLCTSEEMTIAIQEWFKIPYINIFYPIRSTYIIRVLYTYIIREIIFSGINKCI